MEQPDGQILLVQRQQHIQPRQQQREQLITGSLLMIRLQIAVIRFQM